MLLLTDLFALRSSRYDVSVFMQIQKPNTKIKPDVFAHLDLRECTVCISYTGIQKGCTGTSGL